MRAPESPFERYMSERILSFAYLMCLSVSGHKKRVCDFWYQFQKEIIKVRERIPHIGPLTKVIRLKVFLDIVPSCSENITPAMRGPPKRLSRITWEKWRERHFTF